MSHTLLILKIYTTFKDVQVMLKRFFDISTGFRFSKISVECSVHLCSCPWLNLGSGPRIMVMDPGVHYQGLLPSPILTSRRYLEGVRWLTSKYLPKPFEIKFFQLFLVAVDPCSIRPSLILQ